MGPNHDAYVLPDPVGFKVRPAVVVVARSKPFRMRNLTDHEVKVTFPAGLMNGPNGGNIAAKESRHFPVAADAPDGVHDYHVVVVLRVAQLEIEAIGESAPRIIIDP